MSVTPSDIQALIDQDALVAKPFPPDDPPPLPVSDEDAQATLELIRILVQEIVDEKANESTLLSIELLLRSIKDTDGIKKIQDIVTVQDLQLRMDFATLLSGLSYGTWRVIADQGNPNFEANAWPFFHQRPSIGTASDVTGSTSAVDILAANVNRKGAFVFNDTNRTLYLKLGSGVSISSFTTKVPADDLYEVPFPAYTGIITGIWPAGVSGSARVTELT
jgi:hypothetical protein